MRLPVDLVSSLILCIVLSLVVVPAALATTTTPWTPLGADFVNFRLRQARLSSDGNRVALQYLDLGVYAVAVYEWNDDDSWQPIGNILHFGEASLKIRFSGNGQRLLVGARGEFVRVYEYNTEQDDNSNTSEWQVVGQELLPPAMDLESGRPRFPSSLAISHSGHRMAVSFAPEIAYYGSALSFDEIFGLGQVWIYEYSDIDNEWKLLGSDTPLSDETSPSFGGSLLLAHVGRWQDCGYCPRTSHLPIGQPANHPSLSHLSTNRSCRAVLTVGIHWHNES